MPSKEHDRLIQYALRWIANRTRQIRCAPEVQVGQGYVADAVALSGMEWRYYMRYCEHWGLDPLKLYATSVGDDRHPAEYVEEGQIPCYFGHIFEAKATRSDFLSTFGPSDRHANRLEPVGTTHWVVTEPKVCTPDEVPDPWGLLVRRGSGLSELKMPDYAGYDHQKMLKLAHAVLWKNGNGWGKWSHCDVPDDYQEAEVEAAAD